MVITWQADTMRYALGPWVLDTQAQTLTRDGTDVTPEPKAMAVLEYLVAHAEQVVSRAELADAGWPRQEVSDQTINRVIFVLRRIFREDDQVRILTVHRRGYRLHVDPPVHEVSPVPVVLTHKTSVRWLAPILVILALGLLVFAELFSKPDLPPHEYSVGLIPAQPRNDSDPERLLAYSLNQALLLGLQQDARLSLRQLSRREDADFEQWAEGQGSESLPMVLIEPRLQAEKRQNDDDLHLWLHRRQGSRWQHYDLGMVSLPSPLLDESLANAARESFVEKLHPLVLGLFGLLPFQKQAGDLESFSLYLKAVGGMQEVDCSDRRYIGLLEEAVSRSPAFLDARLGLAEAYYMQVWACGQGERFLQQALDQTEAVLQQMPENSYALGLQAYLLATMGKAEQAVDLLRRALEQQHNDPELLFALSAMLPYVGDLLGSRQAVEQAVEQDPLLLQVEVGDTPSVYFWQQDWDAVLANSPYQRSSHVLLLKAWAQWQLGMPEAQESLQQLQAMDKDDRLSMFAAILAALVNGDSETARSRLERLRVLEQQWPVLDGEQLLLMAVLADLAGNPNLARHWQQQARTRGFNCEVCERNFLSAPGFLQSEASAVLRNLVYAK